MLTDKQNWRQQFTSFDWLVLSGLAVNLIVIGYLVIYWILH